MAKLLVWLLVFALVVSLASAATNTRRRRRHKVHRTEVEAHSERRVETHSEQKAAVGEGEGEWEKCHTCIFTIERIKKGTDMLLPSICSELFQKLGEGEAGDGGYADCHQVLGALQANGNNIRYWLFEGCFKYEIYQAKEWIKPCPTHVICSVLKDLEAKTFCKPLPMENPFV